MDNGRIAAALESVGQLLEILGENPFKVRAYQNGSRAVAGLGTDAAALLASGELRRVAGLGKSLLEQIEELVRTGRLGLLEELQAQVPPGVVELLEIPTVGPKKARLFWKELGITSTDALRKACVEDKLLNFKGLGSKTQKKILEGIEFRSGHQGRFLLSKALPLARRLLAHLRDCPAVGRSEVAGSLRRWRETVKDVDLVASSAEPARVMDHFLAASGIREVLLRGPTKTSVRMESGLQIDLRVVADDEFPFALAYFTGSKEHNVHLRQVAQKKGLKLNEYGLFRGERPLPCADEAAIYEALGLDFLPPELREGAGEGADLIGWNDLRGVFHVHSTWSDGTADIPAMAERARSLGFSYMGLSDHSKAASYANGLDEARLARQMEVVDRLNGGFTGFRILKGLECDILPDGSLDLDPAVLGRLDFVIGSVHSRFDMGREEMTDRICRALADPNLDMLGHATGRLLLARPGYAVDLDRVLREAARLGKVVELNANPNRLDLDAAWCRRARELGVTVSINPDAHSTDGLADVEYGIGTARRGSLGGADVLNTRDLDGVRARLGF